MRRLRRSIARANGELRGHLRDIYAPNRNPVKSEPGPGERGKRINFYFDHGLRFHSRKSARRFRIERRRVDKELDAILA